MVMSPQKKSQVFVLTMGRGINYNKNMSGIYIIISIVVLAIIAILAIYTGKSKRPKRLSKLAMFAMLLVIFGIISVATVQGRLISYSFMGAGVFLAVIDIIKNLRNKQS